MSQLWPGPGMFMNSPVFRQAATGPGTLHEDNKVLHAGIYVCSSSVHTYICSSKY